MSNWRILAFAGSGDENNLARLILESRGYDKSDQDKFLNLDYDNHLHDPFLLNDMDEAIERISQAIERKERTAIYGDYDIDGMSATALLLDGLNRFGLDPVYYIPDRFEEGYGLNKSAISKLKKQGVSLIITVDSGTVAAEQITFAKKRKVDIIVTDHHNPSKELPKDAVALINPKLGDYPFRELAGVGVAYKLICALQEKMPEKLPKGQEKWLLDLVALGSVCDSVQLVGENRVLVSYGLKVMQKTRRIGLRMLAQKAKVDLPRVNSHTLGFVFGPRLNAAGRLKHAQKALKLLISKKPGEASQIAADLEKLNIRRREETAKIFDEALTLSKKYAKDKILVLANKDWSHGIVGIVASRLTEKLKKPVILMQIEGETSKGSARSFGGFSIIDAISYVEKYLIKFGGHDFAAGVSLQTQKIEKFRLAINQYAARKISKKLDNDSLSIDLQIPDELISLESYHQISCLEPFGEGNKKPIFKSELGLKGFRMVGVDNQHLQMDFTKNQTESVKAIAFNKSTEFADLLDKKKLQVIYQLSDNFYQGKTYLQLEVIEIKA